MYKIQDPLLICRESNFFRSSSEATKFSELEAAAYDQLWKRFLYNNFLF